MKKTKIKIINESNLNNVDLNNFREKVSSDVSPPNIAHIRGAYTCPRCGCDEHGAEGYRVNILEEGGIVVGAICEKCDYRFAIGDKEV